MGDLFDFVRDNIFTIKTDSKEHMFSLNDKKEFSLQYYYNFARNPFYDTSDY